MSFQLIKNHWLRIISIMIGYLISLTGYTQESDPFVIDNDKKTIITINQLIVETEVAALENTEIEVIKSEAITAKQYQQTAERTASNDSSLLKIINY